MTSLSYSGYKKVFSENFLGAELNRRDWNVECHPVGWVNQEWQEYIDSPKTVYVEDGVLHLRPVKEGSRYYSGRISTEGKHSFTYGIFEAAFRVPKGAGYLPAFWLMAENEALYGGWPRCGEIDIFEIMGSDTHQLYGGIHYGNPHGETQGHWQLREDFSQKIHTVALKWEEGNLEWYLDGIRHFQVDRWYSTDLQEQPAPYPAPFDHPMYLILNLAVGGEWVGNPDESTAFAGESFEIYSVNVYQKED